MSFEISTKGHNDIINITSQVEKEVEKAGVKDGLCHISCPGSTCGITTIEYEPNLIEDFKEFLEKLAPSDKDYQHDKTWPASPDSPRFGEAGGRASRGGGEKNGQSHLLSSLFKPFLTVPVENAKLILGQWQQIIFCDFDSRARQRTINIKIIS